MEEKVFDIHEIITKLYNVYLNAFISNYNQEKVLMRKWTGGLMDILEKTTHPFKRYCDFLEDFRKSMFQLYSKEKINVDKLKKALSPLVDFYIEVFMFGYIEREKLERELLQPLMDFFEEIDKEIGEDFFTNKIQTIKNNLYTFKIRSISNSGSPNKNLLVMMKILKLKEQIFPLLFHQLFPLKTNEIGEVHIKLPKGIYRIEVPHWSYRKKIEVDGSKEITLFEKHAKWIKNIKTFSGLFLPFLIGLLMISSFFVVSRESIQENIFPSSVTLFLFPLTNIISFVAWMIGGFIGFLFLKKFVLPFLITYLLCWINFVFVIVIFAMDWEPLLEKVKSSFLQLFSLPSSLSYLIVFINMLIAFLAFIIGSLIAKTFTKRNY